MVYVILTKDLLDITKIDSVCVDLALAKRRLDYLVTKCGDKFAYIYETRIATTDDIYVPAVKRLP
jgi:hypothetical protein